MKIKKKAILIFLFFLIVFLLNCNFNKSYAGSQSWNSLDYNVTVNTDGSMDVIETWDIDISETNTLFKDFELDSSKFSGITNVKVSRVENGREKQLTEIYEEQYHVDSNCYYGLKTNSNTFEIAWNVGLDNSSDTRTYKISYTVIDAVKVYSDCTELYWMFLNTDNAIGGKNITGTVNLPDTLSSIEKLRVWGHGDLSGEINRESKSKVTFSMPKISANEMLEIRVVTEENICPKVTKQNVEKLQEILDEEAAWAEEANMQRNMAKMQETIVILICVFILILFYLKLKKYKRIIEENSLNSTNDKIIIDYFRDIPDEKNATPARAEYIRNYIFKNPNISFSNIFSATILDLTLQDYIKIEPIGKKTMRIECIEKDDENLLEDEKIVLSIIKKAQRRKNGDFTTDDLKMYCEMEYEKINSYSDSILDSVKEYEKSKIDLNKKRICQQLENKASNYTYWSICLVFCLPFALMINGGLFLLASIFISFITNAIYLGKNIRKFSALTEEGMEEKNEWNGLKRYMEDFSLLKEKEVPDLILWEKFLVYATAFGISKKVIKQLKVVYPELNDENTFRHDDRYRYLYFASHEEYGFDYIENLSTSFKNAYTAAERAYSAAHSTSSSSSGSGGGFSGGSSGGRRWRWRKLRRPLKNIKNYKIPLFK